jgi:hypothetical protein
MPRTISSAPDLGRLVVMAEANDGDAPTTEPVRCLVICHAWTKH